MHCCAEQCTAALGWKLLHVLIRVVVAHLQNCSEKLHWAARGAMLNHRHEGLMNELPVYMLLSHGTRLDPSWVVRVSELMSQKSTIR